MLTEFERVTDEIGYLNSSAGELLREIADKERIEAPLLSDNLKLLFEPGQQINPLGLFRAPRIRGFAAAPLGARQCRGIYR